MIETKPTKSQVPVAILIGSLLFLYWVILPVVMGSLAESRGFEEDFLGLLASLYSAGIFLASVSSMLWIHRISWVLLVKAGSTLTIVGFAALFLDDSFLVLALGHCIASVGLGVAYAVIMAFLGDQEHPARGFALVFFLQVALGVSASTTMTLLLRVEQIVAASASMMIVAGAICALLSHQLPQGSRKYTSPTPGPKPRGVMPSLPVVLALLAIVLVFTGDAGVWVFLERIGSTRHGLEAGGLMVSTNLAAGACGSLSAAWLSERWGYLWPMVIAIVLSVLSVVGMALAALLPLLLLASFINGWAWNFGAAYRMGLVSKLDTSGRFTVLIPSMQTLGNTLGPLVMGLIIVNGGYNQAFLFAACLWLAALAAYYPAWLRYRETASHEH